MMNKIKAEHDGEMKRLHDAESTIEELTRQLEKEREESGAIHAALELFNSQLKAEHDEKLSDYEQMMMRMEAERKQVEEYLESKQATHKEDLDKHLGDHKDTLCTYESEIEALKRVMEDLEATFEDEHRALVTESEVMRTRLHEAESQIEEMNKIKTEHDADSSEVKRLTDDLNARLAEVAMYETENGELKKELRQNKIKTLSVNMDLGGKKAIPVVMADKETEVVHHSEKIQELVTFEDEHRALFTESKVMRTRLHESESQIEELTQHLERDREVSEIVINRGNIDTELTAFDDRDARR
jgi:DNA repair exonuclease SbcCD ATPase subunit